MKDGFRVRSPHGPYVAVKPEGYLRLLGLVGKTELLVITDMDLPLLSKLAQVILTSPPQEISLYVPSHILSFLFIHTYTYIHTNIIKVALRLKTTRPLYNQKYNQKYRTYI